VLSAVGLCTAVAWISLWFEFPLLQRMPGGWFWKFHDTPLESPIFLVGVTLLGGLALWHVVRFPKRVAVNLMLLVVCGYGAQLGIAFAEGRGIDGLRDRLVTTGHSEFAVIAATRTDLWEVATRYEAVVDEERLAGYTLTKAPGSLLFFMTTQRISGWFGPTGTVGERFRTFVTFASYVYPLICYLALIPLFWLSASLLDEESRWLPCVLYILLPNVALMTLHLDQVLYPTLFLSLLALVASSYERGSWRLSLLAGITAFLALFFSLALLAAGALAAIFVTLRELQGKRRLLTTVDGAKWLGAFAAGMAGSWLLGLFALGYDPVERYRSALAAHVSFKAWEGGIGPTLYWAASNWLEFAFWIGCPIALLFLFQLPRAARENLGGRSGPADSFAVAVACTLLLLGLFGRTQGEVARLWLFLGGPVGIVVGRAIADRFRPRLRPVLVAVVALQWVTILLIKRFQDFW